MKDQQHYSGAFFAWKRGMNEADPWDGVAGTFVSEANVPGWIQLHWDNPTLSLRAAEQRPPVQQAKFLYRRSQRRFLLISEDSIFVRSLLEASHVDWKVVSPPIDVQRVVSDMVGFPSEYCLGAVWARVEGFGQAMRSIGLFGADLAEAGLFRDLLPQLSCRQVFLRDVRTGTEVLSISNRGQVTFPYRNAEALQALDSALRFLSKRGYISWQIPGEV